MTLPDSTVDANSAPQGGGIEDTGGTIRATASRVSDNTASIRGGGIDNGAGTAALTLSTVTGNKAATTGSGGGIYQATGATTTLTLSLAASAVSSNRAIRVLICRARWRATRPPCVAEIT